MWVSRNNNKKDLGIKRKEKRNGEKSKVLHNVYDLLFENSNV